MKRAVTARYLMLVVIAWAVLFLPLGNLAAVAALPVGCPHCHGAGVGIVSGQCCCPSGMPGSCGGCGHDGISLCRCNSGSPAFIATPACAMPTWHVSPYVHPLVSVASKLFPLNIFHPPELHYFSTLI
ncbi:MAG: hypothetical protein WC600_15215 [Desulfobaccales bacterium]